MVPECSQFRNKLSSLSSVTSSYLLPLPGQEAASDGLSGAVPGVLMSHGREVRALLCHVGPQSFSPGALQVTWSTKYC